MAQEGFATFVDYARQRRLYHYNQALVGQSIAGIETYFQGAVVLDAGAGRRLKHFDPQIREAQLLVGIDIADDDLRANDDVDVKVVGDLQKLPFEAGVFDCIISVDVVEHLDRPVDFFRETSRTLRPGGVLIICTPNLLGYKNLIARVLPRSVLDLAWRVLKGRPGQPHRTYYRANTDRRIRSIASSAGLTVERIEHLNEISHFSYSYPALATLAYAYGRLLKTLRLVSLLPYLVCVLRRAEQGDQQLLGSPSRVHA